MKLKEIPEAISIPSGFEPKSDEKQNINQQQQTSNCLLFVLHVSAPPYIYFNYGFIMNEKNIAENVKLEMRVHDLQKENESLKLRLNNAETIIESNKEQINELHELIKRLETKFDREMNGEMINLQLQNNWVNNADDESTPQALKIGNMVYLKGTVKNGISNPIATLPEGWRPRTYRRFCQTQGGNPYAVQVRIDPGGGIIQASHWSTYLSLEGICFVINL